MNSFSSVSIDRVTIENSDLLVWWEHCFGYNPKSEMGQNFYLVTFDIPGDSILKSTHYFRFNMESPMSQEDLAKACKEPHSSTSDFIFQQTMFRIKVSNKCPFFVTCDLTCQAFFFQTVTNQAKIKFEYKLFWIIEKKSFFGHQFQFHKKRLLLAFWMTWLMMWHLWHDMICDLRCDVTCDMTWIVVDITSHVSWHNRTWQVLPTLVLDTSGPNWKIIFRIRRFLLPSILESLSLIHIWRCRRIERCRSRWSPYH